MLSKRLQLVVQKVNPCHVLADIGTDHAYIPLEVIKRSICQKVIATDSKPGPLLFADKNLRMHGLQEKIEIRQGDGLQVLHANEVDCIVIAGMGGELIADILQQGFDKAISAKQLVLQSMSSTEVLRKWLYNKGFHIYDEELVNEDEKIYNVICARYDGIIRSESEIYYEISKLWIVKQDPLAYLYIEKKIKQLDNIIIGIRKMKSNDETRFKKTVDLRDQLLAILSLLNKDRIK